jgi:bifunctional non-homologous end joining protein LigD
MSATQITMRVPSAAPKTSYLEILIIVRSSCHCWPLLGVVAPSPAVFLQPRPPAQYPVDVSNIQFILPAFPKLRSSPSAGEGWQYELKFDGYRVQLHKAGVSPMLYGRNGGDLTRWFPRIAAAVLGLPAKSCIIDGELIAAGRHGQPDFLALLHGRHVPTCVYAFDLLELQGRDLRDQPLVQRRARLQALLSRAKSDLLRFSDSFPDANALLAECSRRGLEGIVAAEYTERDRPAARPSPASTRRSLRTGAKTLQSILCVLV